MKLPLSWLRKLINISWSDQELADRLVKLGIGVTDVKPGVLTLEIPPNRGDLLSILGIAREIHAQTGEPISLPDLAPLRPGQLDLEVYLEKVDIPRYTTAVIKGVKIGPTKNKVIVQRLRAAGMRPVNNIVDLTNYLMLETGQPTHAFDWDKIQGKKMILRLSQKGESLETLDGVRRILPEGVLVIADSKKIIDLPGVMGGQNSAVDDHTINIVVQAAVFPFKIIRQAAKALDLTTEASYRFERRVDEGGSLVVLNRLIEMVIKEAGGKLEGIIDLNRTKPAEKIDFDLDLYQDLIGRPIALSLAKLILIRLGCRVSKAGHKLSVVPPTWRHDLALPADLVEEIARLDGYENILSYPLKKGLAKDVSQDYLGRESVKDELVRRGLSEVATYSLVAEGDVAAAGVDLTEAVKIANPLASQLTYFRPSLLPGLFKTVAKNPTYDPIRLFEVGRVARQGKEEVHLAVIFAGKGSTAIDPVVKALGLTAKKVDRALLRQYKIKKTEVWAAEDILSKAINKVPLKDSREKDDQIIRFTVKSLSKFPSVTRDISFIVDNFLSAEEIKAALSRVSNNIYLIELFDEYAGIGIEKGKKSLAFHIHYQDPHKTMTSKEIDRLHQKVEEVIKIKYRGKVR